MAGCSGLLCPLVVVKGPPEASGVMVSRGLVAAVSSQVKPAGREDWTPEVLLWGEFAAAAVRSVRVLLLLSLLLLTGEALLLLLLLSVEPGGSLSRNQQLQIEHLGLLHLPFCKVTAGRCSMKHTMWLPIKAGWQESAKHCNPYQ